MQLSFRFDAIFLVIKNEASAYIKRVKNLLAVSSSLVAIGRCLVAARIRSAIRGGVKELIQQRLIFAHGKKANLFSITVI
jgi:hypothetical protein